MDAKRETPDAQVSGGAYRTSSVSAQPMSAQSKFTTMTPTLWAMLIGLSVIWGGSFFFNGVLVRELPPLTIVFFRVFLAAITLHVWLWATGRPLQPSTALWRLFLVMGLLNNVVPFTLIVYGQTQVASGVASILNATTPLFTLLVAHWATDDEKIGPAKATGIAIGFGGVFVMLGGLQGFDLGVPIVAYLACLGAALSYGFAGVFARRFRALGVMPQHVAAGQLTGSSAMLLPLMMLVDAPWTLPLPGVWALSALGGLAVLCTAMAYILFFRIVAAAGATNVSLVTFLIPVSAIVLGIVFLDETLAARHIVGMVLIGAGLALVDGRLFKSRRD